MIPFIIVHGDEQTHFGLELLSHPKDHGPVFSLAYYAGEITADLVAELAFFLYNAMLYHKQELGTSRRGYLRIVGRPGWKRLISRIGVTMDDDGYIADDQPAVINAQIRRLN